jgi:hypothetical protein
MWTWCATLPDDELTLSAGEADAQRPIDGQINPKYPRLVVPQLNPAIRKSGDVSGYARFRGRVS